MKKGKPQSRQAVLVIVAGLLLLFVLYDKVALLFAAMFIALVASISTYFADIIALVWIKIGELLGMIFPKIILILIYYLILFPLSLFSKLFSKNDALMLKQKSDSTFIERNKSFNRSDFEKPW